MNICQSPVQACKIFWIDHTTQQIKLLLQKKGIMSADNSVNIHFFLKGFKHSSNLCKILFLWVLNLMLELFIKLTHQISAVIDCFFSIVVHILMIGKNLNCLLSSSMLLCFSWCRRGHTCLRFHKLIIHSATKTGFSMPLPMITVTTSFPRVPHAHSPRTSPSTISLTSCTTSAALASVLDPAMERRDLKASLALIWVKREASEGGRFKGKSLLPVRHC